MQTQLFQAESPYSGGVNAMAGDKAGNVFRCGFRRALQPRRIDFATFLGGAFGDGLQALALSPGGEIYVTGATTSADFPATPDAIQRRLRASLSAGYVTVLGVGGEVRYSSFLGGSYWDSFRAVLVAGGNLYLGGSVGSPDFPSATLTANSSSVAAVVRIPIASLSAPARATKGVPPLRRGRAH